MTCPFCNYEWNPRVELPKECPSCKRYQPHSIGLPTIPKKEKKVRTCAARTREALPCRGARRARSGRAGR
jgi:hypothetical protein